MFSVSCRLMPLLLLVPASLAAQATLDSVAGRLKPGQLLRLRSQDGQRVEGRFAVYTPAPPTLQLGMGDTAISVTRIDSLWVRGNASKTGAIVGAFALGVPSAVFWGALCEGLSEGTGCDAWGTVAALTAAGAGVGALLGAVIGSASPRWQLRYARPRVSLRLTPLPEHRVGTGVSIPFTLRIR